MIPRTIEQQLIKSLNKDKKVIVLFGPRQVGKTSLLHEITASKQNVLWLNGDEADIRELLKNPTSGKLKSLIGNHKLVVIDEAQRIENIGLCLKLIYDTIKGTKVIATGSSSFELANKINEPLTGRKWEFMLYPLSFSEMVQHTSLLEEQRQLEHRMVYGYYPDVVNYPERAKETIKQLADSYLYKDILTWERILKPDRMERLVQAIAFQLGNQVSYNELGKMSGLDNETVEHYISLLEKSFIVFRLGTFSRNLRNELTKTRKIYFYDNGIRNAVINQFNPLQLRNDTGALWENYLISERKKMNRYNGMFANTFFWRTTSQQEIDYVEEYDGELHAYEFKWAAQTKKRIPSTFLHAYQAEGHIISRENYTEFILPTG